MPQPIPPHVRAAWDSGDRIHAIQLLREATGLGLAEAKELLEGGPASRSGPSWSSGQPLPAHVRAALDRGNKIEAIKLLREATGLGLKEAKDCVDAAGSDTEPGSHGSSPGEVPRGRSRMVVAIAVLVALIVAAWSAMAQDRCMARYDAEQTRIQREFAQQLPARGNREAEVAWSRNLHAALAAAARTAQDCTRANRPVPSAADVARDQDCRAAIGRRVDEMESRYRGRALTPAEQAARRGEEERLIEDRMACTARTRR